MLCDTRVIKPKVFSIKIVSLSRLHSESKDEQHSPFYKTHRNRSCSFAVNNTKLTAIKYIGL